MRRFWFHYNKPASRAAKSPVISVHYKKTCHLVNNVIINTPTNGKVRNTQPFFVIEGKCAEFHIKDKVAYIS